MAPDAPRLPAAGVWQGIRATCVGLVSPHRAADTLVRLPSLRLWAVIALFAVTIALVVLILTIWERTLVEAWQLPPAVVGVPLQDAPRLVARAPAEVWRHWHEQAWIGPAEILLLTILAIVTGGAALLAWFQLPKVHRAGSVGDAFRRAVAAVAASGGAFLLVSVTFVYEISVLMIHGQRRNSLDPDLAVSIALTFVAAFPLVWAWLLARIRSLCARLGSSSAVPNISPRCEGCGYDLTHRPADNRCPECGLNIATSLGPNPRRFGTLWQQQLEQGDPSVLAWFGEARRVLRQPSEYYAQLRLRPERDPGAVFVAGTYIAIGIVACAWFFIMSYGEYSPDDWAAFFLSAAFGTWVAWGCWFGHRLLGSAAFTGWLLGRTLPDSRWAEKVIAYESVFLWAFVAFWLPLVTSYVYAGPWISMTIAAGRRGNTPLFIRGIPLEVLVFIGGTCLLGGLWLWRYHRIGRAIRWSNF